MPYLLASRSKRPSGALPLLRRPTLIEGLAERMERDDFVVGHLARRSLCARARGDGTGWERGAKVNWPSVCLSPSHGNGLSCVPHANTGVHSNMSDVSVQATVSFIITFRKGTSRYR